MPGQLCSMRALMSALVRVKFWMGLAHDSQPPLTSANGPMGGNTGRLGPGTRTLAHTFFGPTGVTQPFELYCARKVGEALEECLRFYLLLPPPLFPRLSFGCFFFDGCVCLSRWPLDAVTAAAPSTRLGTTAAPVRLVGSFAGGPFPLKKRWPGSVAKRGLVWRKMSSSEI